MVLKSKSFLLILILIITYTIKETLELKTCSKYYYSNLDNNLCGKGEFIKQNMLSTDSYLNITINKCGEQEICPLFQFSEDVLEIHCMKKNKKKRNYSFEDCNTNSDCFEGFTCINSKCQILNSEDSCSENPDVCQIGYTCILNNCQKQRGIGEDCISDYDCLNNLGCHLELGKCIEYFSLPIGTTIKYPEKNAFSLCESGEYAEINNEYLCVESILQDNNECSLDEDNSCKYQIYYDITYKNTFTLDKNEKCNCSKGNSGKSYCEIGSNDFLKKKYYKFLKESLKYTSICHTSERINCLSKQEYSFYNQINSKLRYYEYKAFHEHMFIDTSKEIKDFFFPNMKTESELERPSKLENCPKFICKFNKEKSCVSSKLQSNPFQLTHEINLCNSNERCLINFSNLFNEKIVTNTKCTKYMFANDSLNKTKNYIGEPCKEDYNCLSNNCIKKQCQVLNSNNSLQCNSHEDCWTGFYCDKSNKACKRQLYVNDYCIDEYECRNNLGCFKNKCVYYYSLGVGTKIVSSDINNRTNREELCEFGVFDYESEECTRLKYKNDNFNQQSYMKECLSGDECLYENHLNKEKTFQCVCGYSQEGKGYCPFFHDNESLSKNLYYQIRTNMNNKCHTLNRRRCEYIPKIFKDQENLYKEKSIYSPLLYNSDYCMKTFFFGYSYSFMLIIEYSILIGLFFVLFN